MDKAIVVKIGGSTLGSHDTTIEDIVTLQRRREKVVVVHGGGKVITDWLAKQNVATQFVRGERVTNRPSLDVVVAVLAGLINKEIVAAINAAGGRAAGISGIDGRLLEGKVRQPEMGYVGTVTGINTDLLEALLEAGFVPVIAPIGFNAFEQASGAPLALNINADTAAGEIAAAMKAQRLVFLTDVPGILDKSGKLLKELSVREAQELVDSGVASGGMIPKVTACLRALTARGTARILDGREPHALLGDIEGKNSGTIIRGKQDE